MAACKVARLAYLSGPFVSSWGGVEASGAAVPLARMMSGAGGSQGQSGHRGQIDVFHACIVGQTFETVKPLILLAAKCVPQLSLYATKGDALNYTVQTSFRLSQLTSLLAQGRS
jgi:hypothetical protein